jgi:hypothetical protein
LGFGAAGDSVRPAISVRTADDLLDVGKK